MGDDSRDSKDGSSKGSATAPPADSIDGDIPLVELNSENINNNSTDKGADTATGNWAPSEVSEIDLYQRREKIYTRKIEGFFQRLRLYTGWPLLIGYFLLPWISIQTEGGEWRQAVLFDLLQRKFHLLWLTIWPQDMSLLGLILVIAAFALFLVTSLAGRVWCGYTCPQTVWTAIFMWIEQRFEGTRNQRIKLDKQPLSFDKARKKVTKHAAWLFVAFFTGLTFIGYFYPIRELATAFISFDVSLIAFAWVMFFTLATYINAAWLREQVCLYMCPYARFQSAMFDRNTLIVSYDKYRGEPRGPRKRGLDLEMSGLGACVDCQMCVQVCPTGIDIRNGLQYQCITCALCIDACDAVMDKMNYPRGLIRYTTENSLEASASDSTRQDSGSLASLLLRTKVIAYTLVLALMLSLFLWRVASIDPVEISVLPDRQALASHLSDGSTENRFLLRLANKRERPVRAHVFIDGTSLNKNESDILSYLGPENVDLAAGEVLTVRFKVRVKDSHAITPVLPFMVRVDVEGELYAEESRMVIHRR